MKKALAIIIVLFFICIAIGQAQTDKRIIINDKQINYVLVGSEPYILLNEMCQFGYTNNHFTNVTTTNINGIYYYRLKECCQSIGMISANQTGNELIIYIPEGTSAVSAGNTPTNQTAINSPNTNNPLNEKCYTNGVKVEYQTGFYQYPNKQKLTDYTYNVYYMDGQEAKKKLADEYFYPGGQKINDAYGNYYYPNGQKVNESTKKAFYMNGKVARDAYGLYYTDGSKTGGTPVVVDEPIDSNGSYVHVAIYQDSLKLLVYISMGHGYYYELDVINKTERLLMGESY